MSLQVLQQEPTPDPNRTNVPVPTSGAGIWDAISGMLKGVLPFLKQALEFLITFTIGNGGIVAGILLVGLSIWIFKQPRIRGIALLVGGILIGIWVVRYAI